MSRAASFRLRCPRLPDSDAMAGMIRAAGTHHVLGRVAAVTGESIEVEGMTAAIGSVCELQSSGGNHSRARVIGFRGVHPILAPMERIGAVSAGDPVRLVDHSVRLRVGPSLCGRVIDAFGHAVDHQPLPNDLVWVDADRQPPESLDRPPIDQPLQTGVRAIDAMLTCGQGQRLGIFAGSGVGKSTLLGMLARGTSADRIVIGMIGERGREVQEFLSRCLGESGLAKSVVVVATSDRPAAQRVAAAWTATAIAESFRDRGENVVLLLDSITRFAMAVRELGLAAGEPPTTRGYPPSVFNLLPRLVERSGRTGQGSITAFYTVLVEGDDNNEPIADTLRGLLDGHIVLSRDLAAQAHWPPIDILQSLSRLQPHLVKPDTLAASSVVRQQLSEYKRSADLISIGAYRVGSDVKVDTAIAMREPIDQFLTQGSDEMVTLEQSQTSMLQLSLAAASAVDAARTGAPDSNPQADSHAAASPALAQAGAPAAAADSPIVSADSNPHAAP